MEQKGDCKLPVVISWSPTKSPVSSTGLAQCATVSAYLEDIIEAPQ